MTRGRKLIGSHLVPAQRQVGLEVVVDLTGSGPMRDDYFGHVTRNYPMTAHLRMLTTRTTTMVHRVSIRRVELVTELPAMLARAN